MKALVMAAGIGSRLYPATNAASKHLLPVYDKPMIFYPLSVVMLLGIREIMIVVNEHHLSDYLRVFGTGEQYGLLIEWAVQDSPSGIADGFRLAESFAGGGSICLILGDNIFYGQGFTQILHDSLLRKYGATIFTYQVRDAERYGIVEMSAANIPLSIEEKPFQPRGNSAITGLYFFDESVFERARNIKPSHRGELEITSILQQYLEEDGLTVQPLGRGMAWLDAGTPDSLLEASHFIQAIQNRQGFKVGCLEEIAFANGWISKELLIDHANHYSDEVYRKYLASLVVPKC